MISDFFTKPIQRNIITGLSSLTSKERVEVNIDGSNKFTKSLRKEEDKRDYSLGRSHAEVVKNDL